MRFSHAHYLYKKRDIKTMEEMYSGKSIYKRRKRASTFIAQINPIFTHVFRIKFVVESFKSSVYRFDQFELFDSISPYQFMIQLV